MAANQLKDEGMRMVKQASDEGKNVAMKVRESDSYQIGHNNIFLFFSSFPVNESSESRCGQRCMARDIAKFFPI